MSKMILSNELSREKLQAGVNKLADAVKETLGPKGKYVVIDKPYGSPLITNDGVTIAREIELEDKFENMGAKLIKEASSRTEELSGDGTTTATVLTQSILNQGLKYVNNGINPRNINIGIDKTTKALVSQLRKLAKPITNSDEIKNIATVSAKDDKIGKIITDAIDKTTKDGVVTVEEGKSFETTVEVVNGYHFNNGYASPYMVSDQKNMVAIVNNPYVALYKEKINHISEILPILEKVMQSSRELVVIADDFSDEVITTIVMNKVRGILNVTLVKAPGFGATKDDEMKDLSVLLQTQVIDKDVDLKTLELTDLGSATKFEIKKNQTIIVAEQSDALKQYVETIRNSDRSDKEKQIAKLIGGIGVIKVGASTDSEVKEKKARVEDALQSTKAAMDEGIVAGGGLALLQAMQQVNIDFNNEEERLGFDIVKEAITHPFKQIVINSGHNGDIILEKVKESKYQIGYDVLDNSLKDLITAGIIDPVKNIRIALENASSIARLILLTSVAITEKESIN